MQKSRLKGDVLKLEPFDKKLIYLFNLAAKSPLGVKPIFFGDGRKVDSNSIRCTIDFNNSRIPTEAITLAWNTVERCKKLLDDNQMAFMFFHYRYGYEDCYESQLTDGLAILTGECKELAAVVLSGYREAKATPLAEIAAAFEMGYDAANNACRKIRREITKLKNVIRFKIIDLLVDSGYLD